jgi:peptidoglycan/xylan/chitin deacetylase (PgdA/CDA1 family)
MAKKIVKKKTTSITGKKKPQTKNHFSKKSAFFGALFAFIIFSACMVKVFAGSISDYAESITSGPSPTSAPPPTLVPVQSSSDTIISFGSRDKKYVALTFDADMNDEMLAALKSGKVKSWYNEGIMETLNITHTKATIFLTGMWVETYPEETKKLAANPLIELANHSYSHPGFNGSCYGLRPAKQEEKELQIEKTNDIIEKVSGIRPRFFRFPGGCYGKDDLALVHKLNMVPIEWDVVGGDAFTKYSQHIKDNILTQTQNGSIIVLHINGGPNAPGTNEVLSFVITVLKRRGYEFVTLSEMLGG